MMVLMEGAGLTKGRQQTDFQGKSELPEMFSHLKVSVFWNCMKSNLFKISALTCTKKIAYRYKYNLKKAH